MIKLSFLTLFGKWKKLLPSVLILSLSLFFILYQVTMFSVALTRTYSLIKLLPDVDLWVMDHESTTPSASHKLTQSDLSSVRALSSIEHASALTVIPASFKTATKNIIRGEMFAVDPNAAQYGLPKTFLKGKVENIHYPQGMFVDQWTSKQYKLRLGSVVKHGEQAWKVVGVFACPKKWRETPIFITSWNNLAKTQEVFPWIMVKKNSHQNINVVKKTIARTTHLTSFEPSEVMKLAFARAIKEAGLPQAFISVVIAGVILAGIIAITVLFSLMSILQEDLSLLKTLGATKQGLVISLLIQSLITLSVAFCGALLIYASFANVLPAGRAGAFPPFEGIALLYLVTSSFTSIMAWVRGEHVYTLGGMRV